eukprot:g5225.t1
MRTVIVLVLCIALSNTDFTQGAVVERSLKHAPRPPRRGEYCVWEHPSGCRKIPSVSPFVVQEIAEDIAVPLEVAITNANYATNYDIAVLSISFAGEVTKAYANIIMSQYRAFYDSHGGSPCAFTKASEKVTADAMSIAVKMVFPNSSSERVRSMYISFSETIHNLCVGATRRAFNGACADFGFVYVYRHLHTGEFTADVASAFAEALYNVNLEEIGNFGY